MSLYEDLGVDKDASSEDIKRAYRREAQKHHPDKPGGSSEKFHAIKVAYKLLSNAKARAQYDRTGDTDPPVDDIRQRATQKVIALLLSVIDQVDEEKTDLIDVIRQHIKGEEANDYKAIGALAKAMAKRERALKRLRRKRGGQNLLADMIKNDIARLRQQMEQRKEEIPFHKEVLQVLDEYEVEPPPQLFRSASHWQPEQMTWGKP